MLLGWVLYMLLWPVLAILAYRLMLMLERDMVGGLFILLLIVLGAAIVASWLFERHRR